MDQNFPSFKNCNQSQYSKYFPENSIDFEGTNLMSIFDNNSLKNVTLRSTFTHECSTLNPVK